MVIHIWWNGRGVTVGDFLCSAFLAFIWLIVRSLWHYNDLQVTRPAHFSFLVMWVLFSLLSSFRRVLMMLVFWNSRAFLPARWWFLMHNRMYLSSFDPAMTLLLFGGTFWLGSLLLLFLLFDNFSNDFTNIVVGSQTLLDYLLVL